MDKDFEKPIGKPRDDETRETEVDEVFLTRLIASAASFEELYRKIDEVLAFDPDFLKHDKMLGYIREIERTRDPHFAEMDMNDESGPFRRITRNYGLRKKVYELAKNFQKDAEIKELKEQERMILAWDDITADDRRKLKQIEERIAELRGRGGK